MRATTLKYAMSVGLGGMLALGAATGLGQARTRTVAASRVTQYCLPPHDNPDAHRFYCATRTSRRIRPVRRSACFMRGVEERALPLNINSPRDHAAGLRWPWQIEYIKLA